MFFYFWHQRYIVECEKEVEAPAYLRNRFLETVTFDLTPIMKKGDTDTTAVRARYLGHERARGMGGGEWGLEIRYQRNGLFSAVHDGTLNSVVGGEGERKT